MAMIPKTIHQIWIGNEMPVEYKSFQASWISKHPEWEYRLHDDDDCLNLVKNDYPWLLETYESYPYVVQRVDMVRMVFLHKFGGIYIDLDFECLKPLDELLDGKNVFFGIHDSGFSPGKPTIAYCNALMASTPNHPFWEPLLRQMVHAMRPKRIWESRTNYVLSTTGTFLLKKWAQQYQKSNDDMMVYPKRYFYASNWYSNSPGEAKGLAIESDSFAVHYFKASWITFFSRFFLFSLRLLGKIFPSVHRRFTRDNS